MNLTIQQREIFLKKMKVQKGAKISKYAIRQMKTLYEANEEIGKDENFCYDINDVKRELGRLKRQIVNHPRLKSSYEKIEMKYITFVYGYHMSKTFISDIFPTVKENYSEISADLQKFVEGSNNDVCFTLLKDILRLQAALGMKLDVKYASVIDSLFENLYEDLEKDEFVDEYQKVKK